jgi:hypothetical protein
MQRHVAVPLHLSGEAKQNDLILYAKLPATLTGSLYEPQLAFEPGALLPRRSDAAACCCFPC